MKLGQIVEEELQKIEGRANLDRDFFRKSVLDWIFKTGLNLPPSDIVLEQGVVHQAAEKIGIGGDRIVDISMESNVLDFAVPVLRAALNQHIRKTLALELSLEIAKIEADIVADGGDPNESLEETIKRFRTREKKSQS